MAQLKDLIVNGPSRFIGTTYINGFTLNKTVPADAVFTDTNTKVTSVGNHYTPSGGSAKTTTAGSAIGWSGAAVTGITVDAAGHVTGVTTGTIPANPNTDTHWTTGINAGASGATSNSAQTNPYVTVKDNSTYRSQIRLVGGGKTTVTSDASGNITISSSDNAGVTSVATGTGLTGGTITSTGTISINSTYQGYISNGNKAWASHTTSAINAVPVTHKVVTCAISAAGSFAISGTMVAGQVIHVIVQNTTTSAKTITIPNSGNYVSLSGTSLSVPASSYAEINVVYNGTKMFVRTAY